VAGIHEQGYAAKMAEPPTDTLTKKKRPDAGDFAAPGNALAERECSRRPMLTADRELHARNQLTRSVIKVFREDDPSRGSIREGEPLR
jgi:hypothetical protein